MWMDSSNTVKPKASRCFLSKYINEAAARVDHCNLESFRASCSILVNAMEEEASMTSWHLRLVSSSYFLLYNRSVLAKTFQSMFLVVSPGLYNLCSANSAEKP